MASEQLVTALVGQNPFEGEIFRVCVAFECFGIDRQQILCHRAAPAVLGASGLAINVTVLDASDKPQSPCDASRPITAGTPFRRSQRARRRGSHERIVAV